MHFTPSDDFSEAFDDVNRMVIPFGKILVIASYLMFSKL